MPAIAFLDTEGNAVPFADLETGYRPDRWGMPLPLLKALARQKRNYCDISITELVGPPQLRLLKQRHEYSLEPTDLIWASFGTGMHRMLELRAETNALAEEKLVADFEVPLPDGSSRTVRLGGTADHYSEDGGGTLTNYKCTSVYKAKKLHDEGSPAAPDWVAVENCYAFLWRRHGFAIDRLRLCLLLKDWSTRDRDDALNKFHCTQCGKNHMRDSKPGREHATFEDPARREWYPPTQIFTYELPVWPHEYAEAYVRERLILHLAAESAPDAQLPECTADETWNGRRCEHWCEVAHLCHQRRQHATV
jgi:hypothetical protein